MCAIDALWRSELSRERERDAARQKKRELRVRRLGYSKTASVRLMFNLKSNSTNLYAIGARVALRFVRCVFAGRVLLY